MKPAALFATTSLLLVLVASAALSFPPASSAPAQPQNPSSSVPPMSGPPPGAPVPPDGPRHLPVEALLASMQAADSIQVGRVAVIWRDTVDAKGEPTKYPYTERVGMVRVGKSWMTRFTNALVTTSTNLSDQLCPPPVQQDDGRQPWMTTVLWFSSKSRGQAYLNFLEGCGFAGVGGRIPGGLWIDDKADTLLGMMREALPADTVIASFRVARRAAVLAAGGGEPLPKFGDFVRVDSLPVPVKKVAPTYPEAARTAGLEGTVIVQVLVGKDGRVKDMKLAQSVTGLDAPALVAVRQWEFQPATREKKPVAVWGAVPVEFKLK